MFRYSARLVLVSGFKIRAFGLGFRVLGLQALEDV